MKLNLVPARTGLTWVKLGISTFFKQPLAIVGLFFMLVVLLFLTAWLPVLGGIAALVLMPTFILGIMAASQKITAGKQPLPSLVMGAMQLRKEKILPMLVLGALYAGGCVALVGLSAFFDGGHLAKLYFFGGQLSSQVIEQPGVHAALWFSMSMQLVLSLLFWHAPALVHWHGVTPLKSLFFSLVACYKNRAAMIVFGLGWAAVLVGLSFLIASLGLMTNNPELTNAIFAFASLLLMSMFFTSLYFSFRDSFEGTAST